jgi:hypothetical protein
MANNLITTRISAQVLKFKPGGLPATFEVTVTNDSDQFASFQLEILAAGVDSEHQISGGTAFPQQLAPKNRLVIVPSFM